MQESAVLAVINTASANGANNFILEDILRGLAGSALGTAASIDGGETF